MSLYIENKMRALWRAFHSICAGMLNRIPESACVIGSCEVQAVFVQSCYCVCTLFLCTLVTGSLQNARGTMKECEHFIPRCLPPASPCGSPGSGKGYMESKIILIYTRSRRDSLVGLGVKPLI